MMKCDICCRKADWKGMCMQQCHSCGVCVHEECYGVPTEKNVKWKCMACQSVGTIIEGHKLSNGKLKKIKQEKRPVECTLCAVRDGVHAMHALYHDYGADGRQVILPKGGQLPQRLAWVHTLCALTVCSHRGTQGSVYGCDKNGDYEGDDIIHHFVMCGLSSDDDEGDELWVKMLNDHRSLMCTLCGQHETTAGRNLRVPLQCCAGDEDEFPEFKKYHETIGDPCTQAMHVGCAMWGFKGSRPLYRRMWFYPGSAEQDEEGKYQNPVTEIYCDLHARQVKGVVHGLKESKSTGGLLRYTRDDGSKPVPTSVLPEYTSPSVERRASHDYSKGGKPKAPMRPSSDASKTMQSSKSKSPTTASGGTKAKQQSPASITASIPRKSKSAAAALATTPQKQSSIPKRGKYTSPTLDHGGTSPAAAALKEKASSVAEKTNKTFDQSSEPSARPIISHVTPSAAKDTSAVDIQSKKQASVASSTSLMETQQASKPTDKLSNPPVVEGRSAKHVKDSGRAFPLVPHVKRKRTRSISEEKQSDEDRSVGSTNQKRVGGIWMSDDDVQGLVETEELPPVGAPPDGVNPWASLWKSDAAPFELEVVVSAKRKSRKALK